MDLLLLLLFSAANLVLATSSSLSSGDEKTLFTEKDEIEIIKGISVEEIKLLTYRLNKQKQDDASITLSPEDYHNEVMKLEPRRLLDGINDFTLRQEISHKGIKKALNDFISPVTPHWRVIKRLCIAFKMDSLHYFSEIFDQSPDFPKTQLISTFIEVAFKRDKRQWTPFLLALLPKEALPTTLMTGVLNCDLELVRCLLGKGDVPFLFRSLDWDLALNMVQAARLPISVLLLEILQSREFDERAPTDRRPELNIASLIMKPGWLRNRIVSEGKISTRLSMEQHIGSLLTATPGKRMNVYVYERLGGIRFVLSIAAIFYTKEHDAEVREQMLKTLDVSQAFMDMFVREFAQDWVDTKSSLDRIRVLSRRGISLPLPFHPFDPQLSNQDCIQALNDYGFYVVLDDNLSQIAIALEIYAKNPKEESLETGPRFDDFGTLLMVPTDVKFPMCQSPVSRVPRSSKETTHKQPSKIGYPEGPFALRFGSAEGDGSLESLFASVSSSLEDAWSIASSADLDTSSTDFSGSQSMSDSASWSCADMSNSGSLDTGSSLPAITVSPSPPSASFDGPNQAMSRTVSPCDSPSKILPVLLIDVEQSMSGSAMSIDEMSDVPTARSAVCRRLVFSDLDSSSDLDGSMDVEIGGIESEGEADSGYVQANAFTDDAPSVAQIGPSAYFAAGNASIATLPRFTFLSQYSKTKEDEEENQLSVSEGAVSSDDESILMAAAANLEDPKSSDISSEATMTILSRNQEALIATEELDDQENGQMGNNEIEEPGIEQNGQERKDRDVHEFSPDGEEGEFSCFREKLVRISDVSKRGGKRAASLSYGRKEVGSQTRAVSVPPSFKLSKLSSPPMNFQPQIVLGGNKASQQVPSSVPLKAPPSEPRAHVTVGADAPVIRTVPGDRKASQQAPRSPLIKAPRPEPKLGHHSVAENAIPKIVAGGNKASQQFPSSAPHKASPTEPRILALAVADDQVPSHQSMVDAAFSSADTLAQFSPVGPYTVTLSTVSNAPANIFAALTPAVLEKMLLAQNEKFTEYFESEKGLEMLGHLGHEGNSCAYEQVGKFFTVLGPKAMASLRKEALMIIMPAYFALLLEHQFEVLDFSWLLPDQVAQIPAQLFARLDQQQAAQFKSASLDRDAAYSPCAGLTASQLNALPSKEIFSALGEVCQKQIRHEELHTASKEVLSWIPLIYFEQSLAYDQPGLESLIKNATIEQLSHIPQVYVDESLSPFFGLIIDLATFGGEKHHSAMRTISPQTIEIVDPETLKSMGPGDFALLSDEVRRDITCESFGYIPPTAVPTSEVISLSVQNTKLCPHLTPEHFSDLPSNVALSSACAGKLAKNTWDYLVSSGAKLPTSFLWHATSEHMSSLSSISSESLTASHWSKLGTGTALDTQHPCESIRFADIADVEEFWRGINLACFSSLPCLDEVTEEQFKMIKTSVRDNLPVAVRKELPEKIRKKFLVSETSNISPDQITPTVLARLSSEELFSVVSNGLAGLPFETLGSLNKEHVEVFAKKKDLLEHATARMISSCNPKFLGLLTADQIDLIPAEACAGLTRDHLANLDISFLPPTSFSFIEPVLFTTLTSEQLERIPEEAWSSSIFKEQVEYIKPTVLANFIHLDQFGVDVDPLSPHHPCLGITDGHRASFGPRVQEAFWKHCKPVFDSHDLERRMTQRTQKSE